MITVTALLACSHPAPPPPQASADARPDGYDLFVRTWTPNDPLSPGGDGLGPYFNADSCVACHGLGGVGGAGGLDDNVDLFVHADGASEIEHHHRPEGAPIGGVKVSPDLVGMVMAQRRSAIVHRNPPALFGAGAIDAVALDEVLEVQRAQPDDVVGKIRRRWKGEMGRFGWRGETTHLADFVEGACANELGLQTANVDQPGGRGPGLDMSAEMVVSLTKFVAQLPPPSPVPAAGAERGEALFGDIGCADCHVKTLGEAEGIYSDLMIHDLGRALEDSASGYYQKLPNLVSGWRTAPLWGVRDTAPYMHDGRALTLKDAIEAHDGQGRRSREAFAELEVDEAAAVLSFLGSLAAPPPAL